MVLHSPFAIFVFSAARIFCFIFLSQRFLSFPKHKSALRNLGLAPVKSDALSLMDAQSSLRSTASMSWVRTAGAKLLIREVFIRSEGGKKSGLPGRHQRPLCVKETTSPDAISTGTAPACS